MSQSSIYPSLLYNTEHTNVRNYTTLHVVLYGSDTWSLVLRSYLRVKMLECKVTKRTNSPCLRGDNYIMRTFTRLNVYDDDVTINMTYLRLISCWSMLMM
jgi:hypothetical protein